VTIKKLYNKNIPNCDIPITFSIKVEYNIFYFNINRITLRMHYILLMILMIHDFKVGNYYCIIDMHARLIIIIIWKNIYTIHFLIVCFINDNDLVIIDFMQDLYVSIIGSIACSIIGLITKNVFYAEFLLVTKLVSFKVTKLVNIYLYFLHVFYIILYNYVYVIK